MYEPLLLILIKSSHWQTLQFSFLSHNVTLKNKIRVRILPYQIVAVKHTYE
jgi:hypothetical protein